MAVNDAQQTSEVLDALLRWTYSALFDSLVASLNSSMCPEGREVKGVARIGLLDICNRCAVAAALTKQTALSTFRETFGSSL